MKWKKDPVYNSKQNYKIRSNLKKYIEFKNERHTVFLDGTVENCGDDYSLKCNLSQFQQIDRYVYIKI